MDVTGKIGDLATATEDSQTTALVRDLAWYYSRILPTIPLVQQGTPPITPPTTSGSPSGPRGDVLRDAAEQYAAHPTGGNRECSVPGEDEVRAVLRPAG